MFHLSELGSQNGYWMEIKKNNSMRYNVSFATLEIIFCSLQNSTKEIMQEYLTQLLF